VINHTSAGAIIIAAICVGIIIVWNKLSKKPSSVPQAFIIVIIGSSVAAIFKAYMPTLALHDGQFVRIPSHVISQITIPDPQLLFSDSVIWRNAVIICFVATLETLLSITAIDKLDNKNRITPQNRELVAQGFANFISGMVGGLPITAVIVRSSANVQAGAQSKWSAVLHGVWLLIAILFGVYLLDFISYCVLAVILIQTGYSLAKPHIFKSVYRQGNEQFMPFIVTFFAILFTDLLIGVGIGISYAIYFLIKHTYRAGYSLQVIHHGHTTVYKIELALNVSFMNKKRILDMLESIPSYSEVEINGVDSVYIDRDVLEVIQEYRSKAKSRHIQLTTFGIAEVETLVAH
ncbi:MAG TPA: solute carrier family 23 protein, partial [Chitinophagales bacterium]|nr:solute carrier family 23 protein [Chitinophagales bacterium]HNE46233.1 solute carrier family 23 protein [Chitinophagales bacterium]